MATLLSSIESQARLQLKETVASYWTSAELIDICNKGIKDMWGAIIDLHQEHFLTVDTTNVSLAANSDSLTGVPSDVFRVHIIEPKVTIAGNSGSDVMFFPRDYNSHEFQNARQISAQNVETGLAIFYTLTQAGAPIAAPTVLTAPQITAALSLRFVYVPILAAVASGGNNPIPGESDNALIAWTIAYARAKVREDASPDANWLAVYATEKQNILTRLTPRQTQEPDVVDDLFGVYQ